MARLRLARKGITDVARRAPVDRALAAFLAPPALRAIPRGFNDFGAATARVDKRLGPPRKTQRWPLQAARTLHPKRAARDEKGDRGVGTPMGAVIMHRILVDGTQFRWTREQAAAAA
jgi:hypothetical protein